LLKKDYIALFRKREGLHRSL